MGKGRWEGEMGAGHGQIGALREQDMSLAGAGMEATGTGVHAVHGWGGTMPTISGSTTSSAETAPVKVQAGLSITPCSSLLRVLSRSSSMQPSSSPQRPLPPHGVGYCMGLCCFINSVCHW